ncbi:MAG: hypothetical protein ACRC2T_02110 [Thermoguttaceae bacterium]
MIGKYSIPVLVFICLAAVGCNNGNVPLKGKVTFSDDGAPLTSGAVVFEGENIRASGKLDNQGIYVVGTKSDKDGIPPGTYKVALVGAGASDGNMEIQDASGNVGSGLQIFKAVVDTKFTNPQTSGLTITVDRSTKTFDFEVDRPQE